MCAAIYVSDSISRMLNNADMPIVIAGYDVFECLKNFAVQYPAVKPYLFDDKEELTPFINVYLNGSDVRFLKEAQLAVSAADKIEIIPSLSGG